MGFPTEVENAEVKVLEAKKILAHEVTENEAHQNLKGMAVKLKGALSLEAGIREYQLTANYVTELVIDEAEEYSRFKPKYRIPNNPDVENQVLGQLIADQMLCNGSPLWALIDNPVFAYDSDPELVRLYHHIVDARNAGKDKELYPKIEVENDASGRLTQPPGLCYGGGV